MPKCSRSMCISCPAGTQSGSSVGPYKFYSLPHGAFVFLTVQSSYVPVACHAPGVLLEHNCQNAERKASEFSNEPNRTVRFGELNLCLKIIFCILYLELVKVGLVKKIGSFSLCFCHFVNKVKIIKLHTTQVILQDLV